jgi:hypothetical protein
MRMKRSGSTSTVVILAIALALVAAIVVLFLMAGDSPSGVATRFLTALAKGDSKTLAETSFIDGVSQEELQKKWEATHEVTKYWQFNYMIQDSTQQDANNAAVVMQWVKNATSQSSYGEKYELPLAKRDGKWKVDVRGISREMYPALPR